MRRLWSNERNFRQDRLQVRRIKGWITLPEECGLPTVVSERMRGFIFPNARNDDVIPEIARHSGKMLDDNDTCAGQFALIADSRLHQYFGRVDCTEAKHDLAASGNSARLAVPKEFDPYRSFAGECDAHHERAGKNREILSVHVRISVCTKQRQTAACVNSNIGNGCPAITFHHFTVLVIEGRDPKGSGRLQHGWSYWVGVACRFYMDEATLATPPWIWFSLPVLEATIQAEDRFIAPAGIVCLFCKVIPVILVAARPYHRIDARAAAEHLASAQREAASIEQWIGRSLKCPIPFCSNIGEPLFRFPDAWQVVGASRLQQQYRDVARLRKAASNNGTGRARSADDE